MDVSPRLKELLLQALEHERGGVILYQTALECVLNEDLREEWDAYLIQTAIHVDVLTTACTAIGLDPDEMTPGRQIVRHKGTALAVSMKMALATNDHEAAELVACEAIVLAETKDHANWHLIGACAKQLPGEAGAALAQAFEQVEGEEGEHLYHTKGWCRELWMKALGLEAVLPPPEEAQGVSSAKEAAEAEAARRA